MGMAELHLIAKKRKSNGSLTAVYRALIHLIVRSYIERPHAPKLDLIGKFHDALHHIIHIVPYLLVDSNSVYLYRLTKPGQHQVDLMRCQVPEIAATRYLWI